MSEKTKISEDHDNTGGGSNPSFFHGAKRMGNFVQARAKLANLGSYPDEVLKMNLPGDAGAMYWVELINQIDQQDCRNSRENAFYELQEEFRRLFGFEKYTSYESLMQSCYRAYRNATAKRLKLKPNNV